MNYSAFSTIRISDEKYEDLNILEKEGSLFEENFQKIFTLNKFNELDLDNNSFNELKEEPDIKINFISSNDFKDKTADKNKEKLSKNEIGNKINDYFSDKMEKTLYNFQNMAKAKETPIIIQKNKKKAKRKNCESLIGKKRNLFKIDNSYYYSIFNCGRVNDRSRKIIEHTLNDYYYGKDKNENIYDTDCKKKPHQTKKTIFKRKDNSDNIRKKIKSRFLKGLKNAVNRKLLVAGSRKLFHFLPQTFISNVSKQKNKDVLNLSLKELFEKNFCEGNKSRDLKHYYHNLSVLEYLDKHYDIAERANYNNFKNMKYYQIFNEYLNSKEFEIEIESLKQEKENDKYIRDYIIKANNLNNFFSD